MDVHLRPKEHRHLWVEQGEMEVRLERWAGARSRV